MKCEGFSAGGWYTKLLLSQKCKHDGLMPLLHVGCGRFSRCKGNRHPPPASYIFWHVAAGGPCSVSSTKASLCKPMASVDMYSTKTKQSISTIFSVRVSKKIPQKQHVFSRRYISTPAFLWCVQGETSLCRLFELRAHGPQPRSACSSQIYHARPTAAAGRQDVCAASARIEWARGLSVADATPTSGHAVKGPSAPSRLHCCRSGGTSPCHVVAPQE